MKLRFARRAVDDVAAIADYIKERSPGAALRVRHAIYDALADLLVFPNAGRRQSEEGVRKFVTPRLGYLIYYVVDEEANELVVLAVKHPAQQRNFDDV